MNKQLKWMLAVLMSTQAVPAVAGTWTPFFDVLEWRASEQTASVWANHITNPAPNTTVFDSSSIDFNWSTGLKAGLFYQPENGFWDTKVMWTYFPDSASVNIPVGANIITSEFFSGFLSSDAFFGAYLNWQLNMNMVDLQASHAIDITKTLSIRPAVGIKGGGINQTINANWDAVVYTSIEQVRNNYFGIGPSFGLGAKWDFYPSWSLVGDINSAFMWGRWNVTDTYYRPVALLGLITETTISTSMNDSQLGTMMLDYYIGVQYVHEGKSRVTAKLGYEMQSWANQLRLTNFQQLPVHGDLTIQGGTCGVYIDL